MSQGALVLRAKGLRVTSGDRTFCLGSMWGVFLQSSLSLVHLTSLSDSTSLLHREQPKSHPFLSLLKNEFHYSHSFLFHIHGLFPAIMKS